MQVFPAIRLAIHMRVAAPFDDAAWVFEMKHDGFRALAYIGDGRCNLVSRKNNVYKSFAALCAELPGLRVKNAVLDGEIVCLDDEGRSRFNTLLRRRGQPAFYAFDFAVFE
jgi:bifunctional non-homologous end joining protein LigD